MKSRVQFISEQAAEVSGRLVQGAIQASRCSNRDGRAFFDAKVEL